MFGEQHQLAESELGRRHFDLQGRLNRCKTGDRMRRAAQRKKLRQDLWDLFYRLRREGAGNAAGAES